MGCYYNNIDLTNLADTRVDPIIDFTESDWGDAPAGTAVTADDTYSERWTGWVKIDNPGNWTFSTVSNDGVRLWVNDQQLIDHWNQHKATEDSATINFSQPGWYPIRLEHFQQNGTVTIQLSFAGPGQSKTIIPEDHLSATDPTGTPTVDAGNAQAVPEGQQAQFTATAFDSDGTIVGYSWTQESGPGSTLFGQNTDTLTVTNTSAGVYSFAVTVTDNDGNTATDTVSLNVYQQSGDAQLTGELKQWHETTLTFDGPLTSETATPNPFLDYRLNVTFTGPGGQQYVVPGYYAGDGNAGESNATSGNKWRVHFSPDEAGQWFYQASFRQGSNVAVSLASNAGSSAGFFDGQTGTFDIAASDKSGVDFRSSDKGLLRNNGGHYLTFAGSGDGWIKGGPDIPENLLGYTGFDNTPNAGHDFGSHVQDWNTGDPNWDSPDNPGTDDGKALIGAINYISSQGANSIYFLPMNIGGDGKDTFPTIGEQNKTRYDVSKLDQWNIVFNHAQSKGVFLHFQLAETETANENYHDGGNLGPQRMLYYRELVARFGHHPGLEWNIGEENDYGTTKRIQFAEYIRQIDPYDHPVTTHTRGVNSYYDPLVDELEAGNEIFIDMTSFQTGASAESLGNLIEKYRNESAAAGSPWVVSVDEPQKIENDRNDDANGYPHGRQRKLWPTYLSGGGGFEWYVQQDGGGHSFDQQINDYRLMDVALEWTGYALDFMNMLPFTEMAPNRSLGDTTSSKPTFVLAKPGDTYALYNEDGGTFSLNLSGQTGIYEVFWFDPRNGGGLQTGTVQTVNGGSQVSLGQAPDNVNLDWAVLVRRSEGSSNQPPNINNQSFMVAENSSAGTVVGTVLATDPDPGDTLTFAITSGNTGGVFAINTSSGQLTVANGAVLDFESLPSYSLTVQVTDQGGLSDSATVTVDLQDVVELINQPPQINNQTFQVAENAANGTVVGNVDATDPDPGDSLTFAITSGNLGGAFAINSNTGQLTIANGVSLDFETQPTYSLTVEVTDQGGLSDSATITVNLQDVIEGTLPDPWQGTDIGNVAATGSAEFANGVFTVRGSGNDIWNQSDEFHFVYQPLTGDGEVIARVVSQTNTNPWAKAGVMMRNTLAANSQHAMMIITPGRGASFQYRSNSGFSSSHQTTGGLTAPIWTRLVREGDTLTGFTSGDGIQWILRGQTSISLNETIYVGLAVTSHNDGAISTATFENVSVSNSDDPPDPGTGAFLEQNGQVVIEAENFTGSAAGTGSAANHQWISASQSGASDGVLLETTPNSGTNAQDSTNGPRLDYDIRFSNAGTYYVWIRMQAATSADNSVHSGLNRTPTTYGNLGMSSATGVLHWEQNVKGRSGDVRATIEVNSPGLHTFNVWMREDGVKIDKIVLTQDANFTPSGSGPAESSREGVDQNHPPTIDDQSFQIDENSPAGTLVGTVQATDPDSGDTVTFEIVGGNTQEAFLIDYATGQIRVNNPGVLDFEQSPQFTLTVTATDRGNLSDSATITIDLNNLAESTGGFLESGGFVVIEAENFSANVSQGSDQWNLVSNSSASGGQAMEVGPDNGTRINSGYVTSSPRLDYQVNFITTGTYYVWVRGLATGNDNSVHFGVDGEAISTSDRMEVSTSGNWVWSNSTMDNARATITITSTGLHDLNVWMREDGFAFDRFLITTDPNFTPTGIGPAESEKDDGANS